MENQLIVYTPKKNVKKVILIIILGIIISISIFVISAYFGASAFLKSKWNETKNVNLDSTNTINSTSII